MSSGDSPETERRGVLDLSVVIPTYNRSAILERTLEALSLQSLDPTRFEVVVVDDGSDDGTDAMLARMAGKVGFSLRILRQEHGLAGSARSLGVRHAKADIVLLMDSDMLAQPDMLLRHIEAHRSRREPGIVFVGRVITGADQIDLLNPNDREIEGDRRAADMGVTVNAVALTTQNVSLKRDFLIAAGLFTAGLPCLQDTELAFRLKRNGMRLIYLSEAVGIHTQPLDTLDKIVNSGRKYGRTLAEWYDRVPEFREEMTNFGARFGGGWRHLARDPWGYGKDAVRRWLINRFTAGLLYRLAARLPLTNPPSGMLVRCSRELWAYHYRAEFRKGRRRLRVSASSQGTCST